MSDIEYIRHTVGRFDRQPFAKPALGRPVTQEQLVEERRKKLAMKRADEKRARKAAKRAGR